MLANTMSCLDVMYQPYATYFPYQRGGSTGTPVDPFKKYGVSRMHDPLNAFSFSGGGGGSLGSSGSSIPGGLHGAGHSSSVTAAGSPPSVSSSASPTTPSAVVTKEETDSEYKDHPRNTQYLTSNCVLLTYFSGDIAANVDDHFSRALSQPSSFNADNQGSKSASWKDPSPMSQRNFPPSFWNSTYQPPPSSTLSSPAVGGLPVQDLPGFSTDPYAHMAAASSFHGMSSLQDPWRYPLTSQTHTYTPHAAAAAAAMHDFSGYSPMSGSTSNRFNPAGVHYSSLLPAGRLSGTMGGQCDPLAKHTDSWGGSRYPHSGVTDALSASNLASHHDSHLHSAATLAGGIESSVSETNKDLYSWY